VTPAADGQAAEFPERSGQKTNAAVQCLSTGKARNSAEKEVFDKIINCLDGKQGLGQSKEIYGKAFGTGESRVAVAAHPLRRGYGII
jgi:hypothetical protein